MIVAQHPQQIQTTNEKRNENESESDSKFFLQLLTKSVSAVFYNKRKIEKKLRAQIDELKLIIKEKDDLIDHQNKVINELEQDRNQKLLTPPAYENHKLLNLNVEPRPNQEPSLNENEFNLPPYRVNNPNSPEKESLTETGPEEDLRQDHNLITTTTPDLRNCEIKEPPIASSNQPLPTSKSRVNNNLDPLLEIESIIISRINSTSDQSSDNHLTEQDKKAAVKITIDNDDDISDEIFDAFCDNQLYVLSCPYTTFIKSVKRRKNYILAVGKTENFRKFALKKPSKLTNYSCENDENMRQVRFIISEFG